MAMVELMHDGTGLYELDPFSARDALQFRAIIAARKAGEQAGDDLPAAVRAARDAGDSWATPRARPRISGSGRPTADLLLSGRSVGTLCCDLAGFGYISVIGFIGIATIPRSAQARIVQFSSHPSATAG